VTAAVLATVSGFLGGPSPDGDEWCFDFGEPLESNWGAVYGGALAAGTLAVQDHLGPNPDLTLRFTTAPATPVSPPHCCSRPPEGGRGCSGAHGSQ